MTATERLTKLAESLEALEAEGQKAIDEAKAGNKTAEEASAAVEDLRPRIEQIEKERDAALNAKAIEDMQGEFTNLAKVIEDLKKPAGEFKLPVDEATGKSIDSDDPFKDGGFYRAITKANKGSDESVKALTQDLVHPEGKSLTEDGKAMTEGTAAQGGYLVRPAIERQIVEARELDNVLRGLCSSLNVTTNAIQLDQIGLTTVAGWVAELAAKPETTGMTLATITANVFTAAGLATISNQLLADSNPAVDGLVTADIAKRLVALEETAFISGSGTNQPLGILNTPGIGATALTSTLVVDLLDAILDSVAAVETSHGAPSAILMHPRTWTRILKSKDAQGAYYINPEAGPQDPRTGLRGPTKSLWGYPVLTSNRIPTNLGAGTNESRVIVADFKEALILDRQGITVDQSEHVYFTTNQTVFRAEQRVGFTAARTPLAFNVVGGAGLANG